MVSSRTDLSEYNRPEYFERPELFYTAGAKQPEVDVAPERTLGGVRISRIGFRSETASGCEVNDVVTGRMFEAAGAGGPCVVHLHGFRESGAFAPYYLLLGWIMGRFGINSVFITQPYHGTRAPKGKSDGALMLSGDQEQTIHAFRQAVGDMRSAVTWAKERFGGPVGVMGFSLGGFISLLAVCVDDRIDFAVPVIASGDFVRGMWRTQFTRTLVRDFEKAGLTEERVRENWGIIFPIRFRPKIALERIQLIGTLYDTLVPARSVEELWEAWGRPPIVWLPTGHVSVFLYARRLVNAIVGFILRWGRAAQ